MAGEPLSADQVAEVLDGVVERRPLQRLLWQLETQGDVTVSGGTYGHRNYALTDQGREKVKNNEGGARGKGSDG